MAAALLLGAGFGRRFGSDKRLAETPGGEPLLIASLHAYQACRPRWLVLREDDAALRQQLSERAPGWHVAVAADADQGMGHSLAAGAAALRAAGHRGDVLIGLCDMPFLRQNTVSRLQEALEQQPENGAQVLQPTYNGASGHPVAFAAGLLGALCRCRGDRGARELVRGAQNDGRYLALPVDDPGVLQDVDQPQDLRR